MLTLSGLAHQIEGASLYRESGRVRIEEHPTPLDYNARAGAARRNLADRPALINLKS
jgi:hypothetical protein